MACAMAAMASSWGATLSPRVAASVAATRWSVTFAGALKTAAVGVFSWRAARIAAAARRTRAPFARDEPPNFKTSIGLSTKFRRGHLPSFRPRCQQRSRAGRA